MLPLSLLVLGLLLITPFSWSHYLRVEEIDIEPNFLIGIDIGDYCLTLAELRNQVDEAAGLIALKKI